jgi:NlpC/P60 family putative phage cell wall peptidase
MAPVAVRRQTIVSTAREWIGTPFVHAGRQKGLACDCIGLFLGVARELGIADYEPANYSAQVDADFLRTEIERFFVNVFSEPEAGDLLLLRFNARATHCAMATGDGTMIHAYDSPTIRRVVEHRFDDYWRRRLVAVYRLRELI